MSTKEIPSTRRSKLSAEKQALLEARLRGGKKSSSKQTIAKRPDGPAPLSFSQQRMWLLDQLDPGNSVYNVPIALRLRGLLNVAALERALTEIVERHEVLRTIFVEENRQPVQVIAPDAKLDWSVLELAPGTSEAREAQAMQLLNAEGDRPFDLRVGPLFRATLIRFSETDHILILNTHHIVSDGWSTGVLMQEITELYAAFCAGRPSPLEPLAIQYADVAYWQREQLQGAELEAQLAYWKHLLGGHLPVLQLPTDRPRPAVQTYHGDCLTVMMAPTVAEALKRLSQQEGSSLFMTLLAAYNVLLYRYTGQEDLLVGTPIANRNREEIEGLIGFFVNTLVLRTKVSGNLSFRRLLQDVRELCLESFSHQDVPFEKLIEELQPARDMSYAPLFQTMFIVQNATNKTIDLAGVTASPVEAERLVAKFDLTLAVQETADGLVADWEYNTDLFDRSTIERMANHFATLLDAIVADAEQPIAELPLLTEAEKAQLLVQWNDTTRVFPDSKHFPERFAEQAERTPDAVAVECAGQQLTYGELNRRANQVAHYLQKCGVGPEVMVGICVERSLEMVVGLLGILKAGGAYVPLDPAYPQERLAYMLSDSQVSLLLTQAHLLESLPCHQAQVICLDRDWASIAQERTENPAERVQAEHLAYVIYTSGSTGKPKGTLIVHGGLTNYLNWSSEAYRAQEGQGVPVHSSIAFDLTITGVFTPLAVGQKIVIVPQDGGGVDNLLAVLQEHQDLSYIKLTPAHLKLLSQALPPEQVAKQVRGFVVGGEALTGEDVAFWREHAPETVIYNEYGPTETVVGCCVLAVPAGLAPTAGAISIGRPIANTELYVLDANRQLVPVGVPGELYIGGAGVARGYLNRPDLTEEKFIPHPFSEEKGARVYKTGDLMRYLPDGNLEFLGRIDDQVKLRGYRIELGEIESLIHGHPAVRQVVVIAREDVPGDKRLVAYLVLQEQAELEIHELRQALKQQLPEYMVPSSFMTLDALPLTSNGKVNRRALPMPEKSSAEREAEYVAPRTPTELALSEIWSEVLGVERIGAHDHFFALGGHSLLATQVISRIEDAFNVRLALRAVFQSAHLADLAQQVEAAVAQEGRSQLQPIPVVSREQKLLLSYAQQRLWFVDRFMPESALYNMANPLRLQGVLDVAALERSWQEIVRRHEVLRTTFAYDEVQPYLVIADAPDFSLPVVDLQAYPEEEREVQALRLVQEDAHRSFDLHTGPLWRVQLIRLAEQEHILLLNVHHIISDGWSNGVLIEELTRMYEAFAAGQPTPLDPLPMQYADYAQWQREWLQGDVVEEQLAYWKQQLRGNLPILELPTSRPRPAERTYNGSVYRFALSKPLSDSLQELSRREGATLYMTLLATFNVLLYRYTGQEDVLVGSPIAGRNRRDIEGLIGFFINTLVLRTELAGDISFREVLNRVRDVTLGAFAHQDLPFEKLVDEVQPERNLSHSPLFQVMFLLQNTPVQNREMSGLTLLPLHVEESTAKFDLTWGLQESADGLLAEVEYNTDLYDESLIARMVGHWQTLLAHIVESPNVQLARLNMLTAPEREQLLVEWNPVVPTVLQAERPTLHQIFEQQAVATPAHVAVRYENESLTYAELNGRANQVARHLQKRGVKRGDLVGLAVERSLETIIGILGILKAGAAYVPLDPAYPVERLAFMIEDAQMPVLLTQERVLHDLPQHEAITVCLDRDWAEIAQESAENVHSGATGEDLAYIIYTSGSTGKPKGVLVNHANVVRLFTETELWFHFNEQDVWTMFHSYAFDFSVWEIWGALLYGGRLVVVPYLVSRDSEAFYQLLVQEGVTVLNQTPSAFRQLIRVDETADIAQELALRYVVFGGEALELQSLQPWFDRHGDCKPQLVNMYGITETTVHVTYRVITQDDLRTATGSVIGRPIPDLQVYVLDPQGQPVPIGVIGEMYVGGAGVARGYLNRSELTAERFVKNPFVDDPSAKLYRSGDLARFLPNGDLEYQGRIDHQVKIRGFRIELGEIEAALAQHPALHEVVVIAREDSPGSKRLVAYVVARQEMQPTVAEMRQFLQERLPEYMVPAFFVELETMPLTSNGKVDRKALPRPEQNRLAPETTYVAPRTDVENTLAEVWADVLGLPRVGIHDNFFELGGDSIISIQIIARAARAGLRLTPKHLFQHQTIAMLATVVEVQEVTEVEQGVVTGDVPLLPIQNWFFELDLPERHHWNMSSLFEIAESVSPAMLQQAVQQVVVHHDALRLRFVQDASGWRQYHADVATEVPFDVIDLAHLPEAERSTTIEREATKWQAALYLADGPLLRAVYFQLGSGESGRLLLACHHLVMDGVSWRVVAEDLETICQQLLAGQPIQLPPKTTSFKRWAEQLTEYVQSPALCKEANVWLAEERKAVRPLPLDFPATDNRERSTQGISTRLSQQETRELLQEVPKAYRTQMNDALLTALAQVVAEWTGDAKVLVDLEGHGREDVGKAADLSRTVGWFTTQFPVLLDAGTPDTATTDVLKSVKEQLRQIPHKGIGYGLLRYTRQDAEWQEALRTMPQADISFNYLGQFDQAAKSDSLIRGAQESMGLERSPLGERPHAIDVVAIVTNEQLQIVWHFSDQLHQRETIERLADAYVQALRHLIKQCLVPGAGGFTPSDFQEARISQKDLDTLLSKIRAPRKRR